MTRPPKKAGPDATNAEDQPTPTNPSDYKFSSADRQIAGYEDAASHLLAAGLLPAPNVVALRSMWKAGGRSRRVAQIIAHSWEMAS
jgi:hypothetical protein